MPVSIQQSHPYSPTPTSNMKQTGLLQVNTLAPPSSSASSKSPMSPILARKKFAASQRPFPPESEDEITFGINDSAEDHKFQSYHLDYKYTPPIHKGPCCVCKQYIIGSMVTALDAMWCPSCFLCTNCGIELRPAYFMQHDSRPYCKRCHNKLFLPPCHACGSDLLEKIVKANNQYYHPECFICCKCKSKLESDNYFERDGKLYCPHDYNDLFMPKCGACYKPITEKPVFVLNKKFHPKCFRCTECKKVLAPDNFFEKNGLPYCEDDYHNLFSPKCHGCQKPIKEKPLRSMGYNWHEKCFKCTECKIQLSPNKFMEKNGLPYCEDDYHRLFSPKCHGCQKPIKGEPMKAMSQTWHPACFKCTECRKQLTPKNYFEKNGLPYCEDDYHRLFTIKCHGCEQPVKDGNPLTAMSKQWHPTCFRCVECHKQLTPTTFFEKNGLPYCEDDYHRLFSAKCHGCKKPIKGEVLKADGKTWHPEHFCCSKCHKHLSPKNYREKDGSFYCLECFHELFSEKCAGCHRPILDKAVFANGKYWHPEHFKCENCSKALAEDAFYEHNSLNYCEPCYLRLFAPKCHGCKNPITNQVYLFISSLNREYHSDCFCCKECKCILDENTFYEFDGEPYCEHHYHARICPDCIKMRRAVERYLHQPEGSSSRPDSVVAYRNLNLPLSRSGSRMSLYESDAEQSRGYSPNPIPNHNEHRDDGNQGVHTHLRQAPIQQQSEPREVIEIQEQLTKNYDKIISENGARFTQLTQDNWTPPAVDLQSNSIRSPNFYRRDMTFNKSSGELPGYKQFESTFQKEMCEKITRY